MSAVSLYPRNPLGVDGRKLGRNDGVRITLYNADGSIAQDDTGPCSRDLWRLHKGGKCDSFCGFCYEEAVVIAAIDSGFVAMIDGKLLGIRPIGGQHSVSDYHDKLAALGFKEGMWCPAQERFLVERAYFAPKADVAANGAPDRAKD